MRNIIIAVALFMAVGMTAGCARTTWINDITVSPDGSRIDVVGAQMKQFFGGWIVDRPLRWVCMRNAVGILECNFMAQELPTIR
jgi:hypothetical protein